MVTEIAKAMFWLKQIVTYVIARMYSSWERGLMNWYSIFSAVVGVLKILIELAVKIAGAIPK